MSAMFQEFTYSEEKVRGTK